MIFKNLNKSFLALMDAEEHDVEDIKEEIKKQDGKIQQMLLWSNISAVWSYLILVLVIVRFYGSLLGKHSILLFGSLFIMYILLAIYMYVVWKGTAYQKIYVKKKSEAYLEHHMKKLSGQCKIISVYLIIYAVLLIISSAFFYMDINNGITLLFKITAPLNLITYIAGIYFIIAFTVQKRKLDILNKQFDKIELMKKFS
jgi:hypothetical protein